MIPKMHEFMQRQAIKDKIHQVTTEVFGFKILSEDTVNEIEGQMFEVFEMTAKSMSKKAQEGDTEMMTAAVLTLLDIVLTNLIIMYFQNKFIESYEEKLPDED